MSQKIGSMYYDIGANTTSLKTSLTESKSGLLGLAKGFLPAIAGAAAFASGVKLLSGAIKDTINDTADYGMQVRDLSLLIGSSAEESSKLIQAADDVFISYETMSKAMQAAIRLGVQPTITGMGELSDQYNAIQDPIAKSKFLMETFGRSGADLAPLMKLGAAGIKALGDEAEKTGLVMDEKAVESAIRYKESLDNMQDTVDGLKTRFGLLGMTMATEVINNVMDMTDATDDSNMTLVEFLDTAIEGYSVLTRLTDASEAGVKVTKEQIWHYDALGVNLDQVTGSFTSAELSMISYAMAEKTALGNSKGYSDIFGNLLDGLGNSTVAWGYAESAAKDYNGTLEEQIKLQEELALASGKVTQEQLDNSNAQEQLVSMANQYGIAVEDLSYMMKDLAISGGGVNDVLAMIVGNLMGIPQETRVKILIEQFGYKTGSWVGGIKDENGQPIDMGAFDVLGGGAPAGWTYAGPATTPGKKGWYTNDTTGQYQEFANGGRFSANQDMMVGEEGIEMVKFDRPGVVIPNNKLGDSGGGNDLLMAAIARMPTARDIAVAVRDAILMTGGR
jgi:hypothetical protein